MKTSPQKGLVLNSFLVTLYNGRSTLAPPRLWTSNLLHGLLGNLLDNFLEALVFSEHRCCRVFLWSFPLLASFVLFFFFFFLRSWCAMVEKFPIGEGFYSSCLSGAYKTIPKSWRENLGCTWRATHLKSHLRYWIDPRAVSFIKIVSFCFFHSFFIQLI